MLEKHIRSAKSGIEDTPEGKVFLTVHVPSPKLVITGAVHISQTLAPMGQLLGYDVTIVDPRTAFASIERFPDVKVIAEWPDVALPPIGIDHYTAFVALTHDPKIDDPGLDIALKSDCFYIGALGSRKTHARRVERLKAERGFTDNDIGRIHSPIGLDIGSVSPAEIAVAIIGEITQSAAARTVMSASASMKFGPVPPREAEGATAVHTIRQGALVLKKGTLIGPAEVAALEAAGIKDVVVARLEPGDVSEDKAAAEIAKAVAGQGVHVDRAFTGRANLFAEAAGVLVVDKDAIDRLNRVDEAITFATLAGVQAFGRGRDDRHGEDHSVRDERSLAQVGACGRRQAVHPRRALQDQEGRRGLDPAAGPRHQGGREDAAGDRGASGAGRRHHRRRAPRAA